MTKKVLYQGFSTKAWVEGKKTLSKTNTDIVKEDLYNHIYTEYGDRVHMLGFGTRIPYMQFEPVDKQTINIIENDLVSVIEYDPRVELLEINIYAMPDNNAIVAVVAVRYIEFDVTENLHIELAVDQINI